MKIPAILLLLAGSLAAQDDGKFAVFVIGLGSATPVAQSLIKQMNDSKPFKAVGKFDDSKVGDLIGVKRILFN